MKEERNNMWNSGFWLLNGVFIELPAGTSHIEYVINKHKMFGEKLEDIKRDYENAEEKMGFEGNARKIILKRVLKRRFIRARHHVGRDDYWIFEFAYYFKNIKRTLYNFLNWAISREILKSDSTIILQGVEDGFYKKYAYHEGGAQTFLDEVKPILFPDEKKVQGI
jgi:hypothetical protein